MNKAQTEIVMMTEEMQRSFQKQVREEEWILT